ncbi:hypothetical protein L3X38_037518 [Prunus dulcis]|uniref:RNase H type-1 domain-containing protein n=1 Tax=Prunus dulcis TaxID=3755 RepID=A0AAD4YQH1_PRUDU|nr:hypothetical protein L3X38_037518 [Prunus dulcis]
MEPCWSKLFRLASRPRKMRQNTRHCSPARLAKELAIKKLVIYSDSQLITNQASGEYMAKHPRMILYLDKVQELLKAFPTFTIQQVPRAKNAHADALASLGPVLDTQFKRFIPVEHLD